MDIETRLRAQLEKLTKWRTVFAGWQLGTRTTDDPECQAVRDHREVTMLMRCDLNALARLLIAKRVFTVPEYQAVMLAEAEALDADYERKFPGFKSTVLGMELDAQIAAETTKGWRP